MANAVTVTLGDMASAARQHIASGRYSSMSEVVRAGLRALAREEAALDALLHGKVAEALADRRPAVSLEEAMALVRTASVRE